MYHCAFHKIGDSYKRERVFTDLDVVRLMRSRNLYTAINRSYIIEYFLSFMKLKFYPKRLMLSFVIVCNKGVDAQTNICFWLLSCFSPRKVCHSQAKAHLNTLFTNMQWNEIEFVIRGCINMGNLCA